MIFFAFSLLIPLTLGVMATLLLVPSPTRGAAAWTMRLTAGCGLGLGISSLIAWCCVAAGWSRFIPAVEIALVLLAMGGCLRLLRKRTAFGEPRPEENRWPPLTLALGGVLSLEMIAAAVSFASAWLREPHGKWDAWLIWNMHARFLYRAGGDWREAFASGLDWSHWDYPLLLPLSIVRSWIFMGQEHNAVPVLIAALFALLTVGLLTAALALLRGTEPGFLAAMLLVGTPFFLVMGASQFADVPLAFYILLTLVLLLLPERFPEHPAGILVLAGLAAGLCAWTKNEGLYFFPVATGCLLLTEARASGWREALRSLAWFLIGALPVLLVLLWFKTQVSPVNDLVAGFGPATAAAKLTDPARYARVAKAFFLTGFSFTQGLVDLRTGMRINPGAVSIILLVAYLGLTGLRIGPRGRTGVLRTGFILGLMLVGYFFVYLLTPLDLDYHLATSLNRLFLQLWPGILLLAFLAAATPEAWTGEGGDRTAPPGTPLRTKGNKSQKIREAR